MKNIIKQIISFILPIIVLIIVPINIEPDITVKSIPALTGGLLLMCLGLFFMFLTISAFIRIGKGTLAPWSPTKKLVITGMYAYVRNPMILGIIMVLTGESIAISSLHIFHWDLLFFVLNNVYFGFYEEPGLANRFGDEYRAYKKHVHRWVPGLKPYKPELVQ
jgi:protein-S-isoprenylcysteine O-methyltransferase Ste14